MKKIIGPFRQVLSLEGMAERGPLQDEDLKSYPHAGIIVDKGRVVEVGDFERLRKSCPEVAVEEIMGDQVLVPGFVDAHTHLCWGGSRAGDYAMRLSGVSYLDIARAGGGIWSSVVSTRDASELALTSLTVERASRHLRDGVTTIEVKSGYGLSVAQEVKILRAVKAAQADVVADLVPTCLAAHLKPKDFEGDEEAYLRHLSEALFPLLKKEGLADRIDIFIEETAFGPAVAEQYLSLAKAQGFALTVHGDQFTTGGSAVAVKLGALSVDHLEVSGTREIELLGSSSTVSVVLPGASMGLGLPYAPARKLLDSGAIVAIASDWNPGSAPMGDLLVQGCVLGAYEKLTLAETLAGLTYRAAAALGLKDRGTLAQGELADLQAYPLTDYRELFYYQGKVKPSQVWKKGGAVFSKS